MSSADNIHMCCQGASMPCCSSLEQLLWQLWSCIFFKCRILVVQSNVTSRATHRANNWYASQAGFHRNESNSYLQFQSIESAAVTWHAWFDGQIIMCKLGQFLKECDWSSKQDVPNIVPQADAGRMFHPQADTGMLKAPFSVYLECGFITATIFLVLSSSAVSFIIA